MGGLRKKQTVGHRYYLGLHMGVARAVQEFVALKVGDRVAWRGSVTDNVTVRIDQPKLFGGDDGEGGIDGTLYVLMGAASQGVLAPLAAMLGGLVPAFRGACTAFFDGLVCSGSPYPKAWAWRVRRHTAGWDGDPWYPGAAAIALGSGDDLVLAMNPAHILYECHTNSAWGRGLPRSRMDDAAWRAAADRLIAEGMGLCLKWSRQDKISAFVRQVVDHIGGAVYPDPQTGLMVLALLREDYTAATLPLFDADSGLLSIDDDDGASQSVAANEVVVQWRNPVDGEDRTVRVRNPGAVHALQGVQSSKREFPGIPTAELALRVAQRELRAAGAAIKRFKVRLDRRAYWVVPGSVFRIRDLGRGIADMVVRAGRVEGGTLLDGAITVTALQDVFGLPATSYVDAAASGWVAPGTTPVPVAAGRVVEMPYRDLVAGGGSLPEGTSAYLAAVAAAPTPVSLGFDLLAGVGAGPLAAVAAGSFCPTAVLSNEVGPNDTVLALAGAVGLDDVAIGGAALVGDEIVRIDAVDAAGATVTVGRGCADTVPRPHSSGDRIWLYDGHGAADDTEYSAGVSVLTKLLTVTGSGSLAAAAAPELTVAMVGRAGLPYPPGGLRLEGASYPAVVSAVALHVSWRHRDRLAQSDLLVDSGEADIGPEAGVSYGWRLLALPAHGVVASGTGVVGNSMVVPAQPSGAYLLELWSMRGGHECWQRAQHAFNWEQLGAFTVRSASVGGTFSAGVVVRVLAGAVVLVTYTTVAGDASLAGVAGSIAAAINAGAGGYSATSVGAVITVTGPLGVEYLLTTDVSRSGTLSTVTVQSAAAASDGAGYLSKVYVGNYSSGTVDPVAAGVNFTVAIERPVGAAICSFGHTTTGSESRATVHSGLQAAFNAVLGVPAGYNASATTGPLGVPVLQVVGPVGADGVFVRASATAPWYLSVTIDAVGSAPVPADLPQVVTVHVGAAVVVGDRYELILAGVPYSYTAAGGDGAASVAAGLRIASVAGGWSTVASGGDLTVTGIPAAAFTAASRVVPGLTVTPT